MNILSQRPQIHPSPVIDLLRVWNGVALVLSDENMIVFMLKEVAVTLDLVGKTENLLQITIKTHFLSEPSMDSLLDRFMRSGVTTARICPQAPRVIFRSRPLLQQEGARRVENEDREGAMEGPGAMRLPLLRRAEFPVGGVDEDDVLGHRVFSPPAG